MADLHETILNLACSLCQDSYVDGVCDGAWQQTEGDYDREALERQVDDIARLECWHEGHKDDFSKGLAEALKCASWQPAAEAPRDGTVVDLWRDGERLIGYRWSDKHKSWIKEHGYPVSTNVLTKQPSHFMLPPPAPREEAAA